MSTTKLKENPELLSQLEEQLRDISGAVRRLLAGQVTRRAIIVLIHDMLPASAKIGTRDIEAVISAIEKLDTQYLKKKMKS